MNGVSCMSKSALYFKSYKYASDVGELDKWQKSHTENLSCATYVEKEISIINLKDSDSEEYEKAFDNFFTKLLDTYGLERSRYILAKNVQERSYDVRLDDWVKSFANDVQIPTQDEYTMQYTLKLPTYLINSMYAALVLHERELEKELDEEIEETEEEQEL